MAADNEKLRAEVQALRELQRRVKKEGEVCMVDAEDRGPGPFYVWWVAEHGAPPENSTEGNEMAQNRRGWDAAVRYMLPQLHESEATVERLQGDLIAAGAGCKVLVCPHCGAPTVDYRGQGLDRCPRDPSCYLRERDRNPKP